ncbi:MAG: hypothetical protein Q8P41_14420 [Pseudomonadota bacterium]|nr:hypothetical protein [Pseudomonadota bacterium]
MPRRRSPCPRIPPARLASAALALGLAAPALAADPSTSEPVQTVVVHASFVAVQPGKVEAKIQQAGTSHVVQLVDDGSDRNDARGDRVYTGTVEGNPAQYLPLSLSAEADGVTRDVWTGVVRVGLEPTVQLAFEVTTGPDGALVGTRRASGSPGRVSHATEALPMMAASFWATFLFVYGAVALKLRGRTGADKPGGIPPTA